IDRVSGLLTYVPQSGQEGPVTVTVQAQDPLGAVGLQTFTIDVSADNNPPVLNGPPLQRVAAGALYRFDIPATDPDGDPLTHRLGRGPDGMSVDSFGRVSWQTTTADVGSHAVQITIADNRGAEIELDYGINVLIDEAAPRVTVLVDQNPVNIGSQVTFFVLATDDVAVANLTLSVDGTPIALDRNGRGTLTVTRPGLLD